MASDAAPGSPVEPQPEAGGPPYRRAQSRRLELELTDPLRGVAGEDRPESWGDASPDERQRLAEYEENRPPHHG